MKWQRNISESTFLISGQCISDIFYTQNGNNILLGLNAFQTYLQHLLLKEVKIVQESSRPDSKIKRQYKYVIIKITKRLQNLISRWKECCKLFLKELNESITYVCLLKSSVLYSASRLPQSQRMIKQTQYKSIFYPIFYWNTLSTVQKRKTTPILNVTSFKPLKSYYVLMEFLLTYCIEMTS